MVTTVPSLLVFEVYSLEKVTILVLVLAEPMLQSILKLAFKEQVPTAVQFAFTMETVILPFALVLEAFVEQKDAETFPLTSLEVAVIVVSVLVVGLAFAMGHPAFPTAHILRDVIVLLWPIGKSSLPVEQPCPELPLIAGPIGKLVDSLSILFVVHPVALVDIPRGIPIDPIAVFLFALDVALVAVAVSKIEVVQILVFTHYLS